MRISRGLAGFALTLLWAATAAHAEAQVCGDDVKAEVAKALSQFDEPTSKQAIAAQQDLYKKFEYCLNDSGNDKSAERLRERACGKIPFAGNLYWEQMPCCGYDPQQQTFACPIEVLQHTGYGAAQFPGSHEHVLVCVDYGPGWLPVASGAVHLADNISGTRPIWNFAALPRTFDREFLALHNSSKAYPARAILSWEIAPQSCDQTPIWGHAVDFQIRLDP